MKKNLIAAALVFGFASAAVAAPPADGKITINGTVAPMLSLTNASNAALDATVNFTATELNAATLATPAVVAKDVQFKLRSNVAYAVRAELVTETSSSDVTAKDIGFRIDKIEQPADTDPVAGGVQNLIDNAAGRTDNVAADFSAAWGTSPTSSADLGNATLDTIKTGTTSTTTGGVTTTTGTQLISGPRISAKGSATNPNNALTVTAQVGMVPQFFSEGTFNYVVKLTMAAP